LKENNVPIVTFPENVYHRGAPDVKKDLPFFYFSKENINFAKK